jgi:hypothetical protein
MAGISDVLVKNTIRERSAPRTENSLGVRKMLGPMFQQLGQAPKRNVRFAS